MQPVSYVKKKLSQKQIAALLNPPPTVAELIAAIKDGAVIEWRKGITAYTSFLDSNGIFRIYLPQEEGKPADPVPGLNVKDWKDAIRFALLHLHLCRKTGHMVTVGSWIMDLCPISYDSLENLLKTLLTDMSPQSREKYFAAALEAEEEWLKKKGDQQVVPPEPDKLTLEELLEKSVTEVDLSQYSTHEYGLMWKGRPDCCKIDGAIHVKKWSGPAEIRATIWLRLAHVHVWMFVHGREPKLKRESILSKHHDLIKRLAARWQDKEPPILAKYVDKLKL
jgi:hypothetical protein